MCKWVLLVHGSYQDCRKTHIQWFSHFNCHFLCLLGLANANANAKGLTGCFQRFLDCTGGAMVLKVGYNFPRSASETNFWTPPFAYLGDMNQNIAQFSLLYLWSLNAYQWQTKLHNSGVCDYCGETETRILCNKLHRKRNGVDRNIKMPAKIAGYFQYKTCVKWWKIIGCCLANIKKGFMVARFLLL